MSQDQLWNVRRGGKTKLGLTADQVDQFRLDGSIGEEWEIQRSDDTSWFAEGKKSKVFISYRRDTGSEIARVMQGMLEKQGFEVFLDVDSLSGGHFDSQLLRQIESARNFVLICSPGSLDRCANEDDWVRKEIAHAIRTNRHIVPVESTGFVWPSGGALPADMADLLRHNAFKYDHRTLGSSIIRLVEMLGKSGVKTGAVSSWVPASLVLPVVFCCVCPPTSTVFGILAVLALMAANRRGALGDIDGAKAEEAKSRRWLFRGALIGIPVTLAIMAVVSRCSPENRSGGDTPALRGQPERSSADASARTPRVSAGGPLGETKASAPVEDFEVLAESPDPAVVTDDSARARMLATRLPWKVRDRKTGIVMLLCPPGDFIMGATSEKDLATGGRGLQRVTIDKPFYLSETEVTQDQWQRLMGDNPSIAQDSSNPVEAVSWQDCQTFCRAAGLRLPSEAEWEYACRAGTTGAHAGELDAMAWYEKNSGGIPHPVRQKRANAWGFHDMHGNVWEWCQDVHNGNPAGKQQAASGSGGRRVLRGGCWNLPAESCRSAERNHESVAFRIAYNGFRVLKYPRT